MVARRMRMLAVESYPRLVPEFESLIYSFEAIFSQRSLPISGPPGSKMLDVSIIEPARTGDTRNIADALSKIALIRDTEGRDKEYQKLAVKAAVNADARLAEEIMSKISNETVRHDTSSQIYSPLVKKACGESDWSQAQSYAAKILDPLGRALAFDAIAKAMSRTKADKGAIVDTYATALLTLGNEFSTERVAKATLVLARALYRLDPERGLEGIKSFAYVLNKLGIREESLGESAIEPPAAIWVEYTNASLSADEILNLADLVTSSFEEVARHKVDSALSVALGINNWGVYSLAQLAVSKVLLEEAIKLPRSAARKQKVTSQLMRTGRTIFVGVGKQIS
jgi:hypothetical protein